MEILQKLMDKKNLTAEEAKAMMAGIIDGKFTHAQTAALLVALKMKGEIKEEIVQFARVMRENATKIQPKVNGLVDTCGTG